MKTYWFTREMSKRNLISLIRKFKNQEQIIMSMTGITLKQNNYKESKSIFQIIENQNKSNTIKETQRSLSRSLSNSFQCLTLQKYYFKSMMNKQT